MVAVLSTWIVVVRNKMFARQIVFTVGTFTNTNDKYRLSFAEWARCASKGTPWANFGLKLYRFYRPGRSSFATKCLLGKLYSRLEPSPTRMTNTDYRSPSGLD